MSLNGYDESDNQGNINNAVVPGDFDIIKATEGVGYTDPNCDANYQQAKGAGKKVGVYHFGRPDGNSADTEAKWFVSQIQGYLGEAVLVLDLEVEPITPTWAKLFLDTVYNLTKVRPWLYMSQSRFNDGQDWTPLMPDYAAWVAQYPTTAPVNGYNPPAAPVSVNGDWTIVGYQYTDNGHLPGWNAALDLDIAYLDTAGWDKYATGDRNVTITPPATEPVVNTPVVPQTDPITPIPVDTTPVTTSVPVSNPVTTPETSVTVSTKPSIYAIIFTVICNWIKSLFKEYK